MVRDDRRSKRQTTTDNETDTKTIKQARWMGDKAHEGMGRLEEKEEKERTKRRTEGGGRCKGTTQQLMKDKPKTETTAQVQCSSYAEIVQDAQQEGNKRKERIQALETLIESTGGVEHLEEYKSEGNRGAARPAKEGYRQETDRSAGIHERFVYKRGEQDCR